MRIEAYTQVQQVYNMSKAVRTQKSAKAGAADKVQISSMGKDYQTVKAAVAGTPDIREEVAAPVKERIQNGTYEVDTESFAEKLFRKYNEMR